MKTTVSQKLSTQCVTESIVTKNNSLAATGLRIRLYIEDSTVHDSINARSIHYYYNRLVSS